MNSNNKRGSKKRIADQQTPFTFASKTLLTPNFKGGKKWTPMCPNTMTWPWLRRVTFAHQINTRSVYHQCSSDGQLSDVPVTEKSAIVPMTLDNLFVGFRLRIKWEGLAFVKIVHAVVVAKLEGKKGMT